MTAMSDALERVYERLLLGMAQRECEVRDLSFCTHSKHLDHNVTAMDREGRITRGRAPNLADAIAALLRDLGVEDVPERVSAEEVREACRGLGALVGDSIQWEASPATVIARLRDLYASGNRGALLAESILVVGL